MLPAKGPRLVHVILCFLNSHGKRRPSFFQGSVSCQGSAASASCSDKPNTLTVWPVIGEPNECLERSANFLTPCRDKVDVD